MAEVEQQIAENVETTDTGEQPAAAQNTEQPQQPEQEQEKDPEQTSIPYNRFKEVNDRAKAAEARLAEIEKAQKEAEIQAKKEAGEWKELYTELETKLAEQRIANEQLRLDALRNEVAQEHGYAWLADRLQGETREDLVADLQGLIAQIPARQAPSTNGASGSGQRGAEPEQVFSEAEIERMSAELGIDKRFLEKDKKFY